MVLLFLQCSVNIRLHHAATLQNLASLTLQCVARDLDCLVHAEIYGSYCCHSVTTELAFNSQSHQCSQFHTMQCNKSFVLHTIYTHLPSMS
jgi:predicted oxidoreductase